MRISFIWAVLLFSQSALLYSQSSDAIRGVVVDPDQAAVPKAFVRLVASDGTETAHTLTDQQGRFSFQ